MPDGFLKEVGQFEDHLVIFPLPGFDEIEKAQHGQDRENGDQNVFNGYRDGRVERNGFDELEQPQPDEEVRQEDGEDVNDPRKENAPGRFQLERQVGDQQDDHGKGAGINAVQKAGGKNGDNADSLIEVIHAGTGIISLGQFYDRVLSEIVFPLVNQDRQVGIEPHLFNEFIRALFVFIYFQIIVIDDDAAVPAYYPSEQFINDRNTALAVYVVHDRRNIIGFKSAHIKVCQVVDSSVVILVRAGRGIIDDPDDG